MAQLNDVKFAALGVAGHSGAINDRYRAWLIAGITGGAPANAASIPDLERAYLAQRNFWAANGNLRQLNDAWFAYLGSLGHTGSLNERWLSFWAATGGAQQWTIGEDGIIRGFSVSRSIGALVPQEVEGVTINSIEALNTNIVQLIAASDLFGTNGVEFTVAGIGVYQLNRSAPGTYIATDAALHGLLVVGNDYAVTIAQQTSDPTDGHNWIIGNNGATRRGYEESAGYGGFASRTVTLGKAGEFTITRFYSDSNFETLNASFESRSGLGGPPQHMEVSVEGLGTFPMPAIGSSSMRAAAMPGLGAFLEQRMGQVLRVTFADAFPATHVLDVGGPIDTNMYGFFRDWNPTTGDIAPRAIAATQLKRFTLRTTAGPGGGETFVEAEADIYGTQPIEVELQGTQGHNGRKTFNRQLAANYTSDPDGLWGDQAQRNVGQTLGVIIAEPGSFLFAAENFVAIEVFPGWWLLDWDNVDGATGYNIYDEGGEQLIGSTVNSVFSVFQPGIYFVRAFNADTLGEWSDPVIIT